MTDFDPMTLLALPGDLERVLRGYQVPASRQLHRALTHGREEWNYPGALDFSDKGTGKSFQTLAPALATGRRVVVLCPSVGQEGWAKAFRLFGAEPEFIGTYEAVRGGWRPKTLLRDGPFEFRWQDAGEIVLILDECQAIRNSESLTFSACAAAIRQGIPIIAASATVAESPLQMRFAGRITGLHQGGDDWPRFLAQHGCHQTEDGWRWNRKAEYMADIRAKLLPLRGCRVCKADLEENPETEIRILALDVPEADEIEREWVRANEYLERLAQQESMSREQVQNIRRGIHMKIWHMSERALVKPVAERIKVALANGRSVAAFLAFTDTRKQLGKIFKTGAGFYGGQDQDVRKFWEREFQANREHLLISNIIAGGASVNLHDVTGERPRTAFVFPTNRAVAFDQALGRVDRVGGMSKSFQFVPVVNSPYSLRMIRSTLRKMRNVGVLNQGDQGATDLILRS